MGRKNPTYCYDEPKQPAQIGQQVVNLAEVPLNQNFLVWLSKIEFSEYIPRLCICPLLCFSSFYKVSFCNVFLPPWPEPFICGDLVLSEEHVHIECVMFTDHKEVLVLHIVDHWV